MKNGKPNEAEKGHRVSAECMYHHKIPIVFASCVVGGRLFKATLPSS